MTTATPYYGERKAAAKSIKPTATETVAALIEQRPAKKYGGREGMKISVFLDDPDLIAALNEHDYLYRQRTGKRLTHQDLLTALLRAHLAA